MLKIRLGWCWCCILGILSQAKVYPNLRKVYTAITPCYLCEIFNHVQIGFEVEMFVGTQTFGEDVSCLIFVRSESNLNIGPSNPFADKVGVNFNMFSSSMLDGISCYVCGG